MKLMERVKATMRVKRYSLRTEKTYCYWIRFYIRFNKLRHPATLTGHEVRQFLEYLAIERHVVAATQNQALNAIVFSCRLSVSQQTTSVRPIKYAPLHLPHPPPTLR